MRGDSLVSIFLMTLTLIFLLFGTIFYLKSYENSSEPKEMSIDELVLASVDIPEITTNLKSKNYIRVQFKLQTDSEETANELKGRDFQVNNLIIQELSEKTKDELNTKDGKLQLENILKTQINKLIQNGEVTKVYITSYIIQ